MLPWYHLCFACSSEGSVNPREYSPLIEGRDDRSGLPNDTFAQITAATGPSWRISAWLGQLRGDK